MPDDPTVKLRQANLMNALHDSGLTGGAARAAARLLDVQFDEADEPMDLPGALRGARQVYGRAFPGGTPESQIPSPVELHSGARTNAVETHEDRLVEASRRQMRR